MRLNDLLSNAEYVQKKAQLEKEIQELRKQTHETEERIDNWLDVTEKVFDFATHAHTAFLNGNLETKKQILMELGSNPTLKDGKLTIEANPWLVPIEKAYTELQEVYLGLELAQTPKTRNGWAQLTPSVALGGEGGIRTHGTLTGTLAFEASTFNHSVTSPTNPF